MIAPVWRAEKHNTVRHLNEARQMDIEIAFSGQKEVMKELEVPADDSLDLWATNYQIDSIHGEKEVVPGHRTTRQRI